MKVLVVGAGAMGRNHLNGWLRAGVDEAAVADVDEDRARGTATEAGARTFFTDYREGIESFKPDAVSVCTPANLHADVFEFSVKKGVHTLCEKPLALTLDQGRRMVRAADRSELKLAIGLQRRLSESILKIRGLLHAGTLGSPVVFSVENWAEVRFKLAMNDKNMNGGPIVDYAPHLIDLLHFFTGAQPKEVFSMGTVFARGKEEVKPIKELATDTLSTIVRYEGGNWLSLDISWGLPRGTKGTNSEAIHGPLGSIVGTPELERGYHLQAQGKPADEYEAVQGNLYDREIAAFKEWVLKGKTEHSLASVRDGFSALAVSVAALKSVETGSVVKVEQP